MPGAGAPEQVTLEKLISWSEHGSPGVRYFSGTAAYAKTLNVPPTLLGGNRHLYLDLGKVQVMAQVTINGKDLGILWKPPYRVEITDAAKAGDNTLEVKVVNLWPNRLIGDEQRPEDAERDPRGFLKVWPQWLQDNRPNPAGRFTFTSWELWRKDDALLDSGLLGPVRLESAASVSVK